MNTRKKNLRVSRQEEILGILLITLGLLVLISLIGYNPDEQPGNIHIGHIDNPLGIAGVYISYYLIQFVIGFPSIVFPFIVILWGWTLFRGKDALATLRWTGYLLVFALYTSIILAIPGMMSKQIGFTYSGLVGGLIAQTLYTYLGIAGTIILLLSLIMVTVIGATNFSFAAIVAEIVELVSNLASGTVQLLRKINQKFKKKKKEKPRPRITFDEEVVEEEVDENQEPGEEEELESPLEITLKPPVIRAATEDLAAASMEDDLSPGSKPVQEHPKISPELLAKYQLPPIDLLKRPKEIRDEMSENELLTNAQVLEKCLLDFGVQGKVVEINPGPVITRYEVEPAPGVKVSRITSLSDDLALAMRAKSIRIVAPIPGKGAVGIEIPNKKPSIVYLREVIETPQFQNSESPLTLALGKTISGEPFVTRLDQMPHLLVAGATGSGKSVCLNTIIASILYKARPNEVQFVMIDPKRLELSVYNNLRSYHLTYQENLDEEVVTSPQNAISVLKSIEAEMEHRYEILARAGVRNIVDYNQKLAKGLLKNVDGEETFEPLHYLILIIDELADLMLIAAREVEEPIARLTQMSRAVGIHLIVATQRPSVDIITGVIKANFPARIAFQVASKTDSRTILDMNGAEKLLGRGDMLFLPPGSGQPIRIHGTYISSDEIEAIISHIRKQPKFPKRLLPREKEAISDADYDPLTGSRDPLFNEALKLVVRHQQGSISLLQRRLKIGYARAARLIDQLEAAGVVGAFDGSKAREVLIDEQQLESMGIR